MIRRIRAYLDVSWLLIGAGLGLLIAGVWLGYPYVHSRLARPARAPTISAVQERPETAYTTGDHSAEPKRARTADPGPTDTPNTSPSPSPVVVSAMIPTATAEKREPERPAGRGWPPTRIVIPSLHVDAPVTQVSWYTTEVNGAVKAMWHVPKAHAAGWHQTSALLGEPGNTVLNGHNTNHGEVFRDLYTLRAGDRVVMYSEEISRTYRVSQTLILPEAGQPLEVRVKNARYVKPTDDERLTLVTCHPYGSLRNRLIIIARPAERGMASDLPEEQ